MTIRSRSLIAIAAVLLLIGGALLWFFVFREKDKPSVEQPKTMAEQLIGSWRLIQTPEDRNPQLAPLIEVIYIFGLDGKFELSTWDAISGLDVKSGTYRLEGNSLQFHTPWRPNLSPSVNEIWESLSTIESITEEELVVTTVTKKRWTPDEARRLAENRGVALEQVLSEVREDRFRENFIRVPDEPRGQ